MTTIFIYLFSFIFSILFQILWVAKFLIKIENETLLRIISIIIYVI